MNRQEESDFINKFHPSQRARVAADLRKGKEKVKKKSASDKIGKALDDLFDAIEELFE